MNQRFDNLSVIVTGGRGGIGGAACRRFCRVGARVAVFDLNLEAAEKVAAAIRDEGGVAQAFHCDITDRAGVNAAVEAAESKLGPSEVLVNNAGWDVFIASAATRVGSSGEAVYAACKGGLVSFSKTIAREHARHGITMNVVCPGPTDTALFADYKEGAGDPGKLMEAFTRSIPLGRIGQPDDLPGAIAFFASDDAGYITGQVLSVSGGLTMNGRGRSLQLHG
jgi:2-hydroxycyclohexanecarboxyl-CoA dehydrogenase